MRTRSSRLCYNGDMQHVLAFLPVPARLYDASLRGILRRLGARFQLQTIECGVNRDSIRQLLKFWQPVGCIVFAAEGLKGIAPCAFADTPVVYLDRTPRTRGAFLDVMQDYSENGRTAARELIRPEISHYAFVNDAAHSSWSLERGKSFAAMVRLNGRPCHVFKTRECETRRLRLLERWLLNLPKPVGLFAANDRTAAEVHALCRRSGIAIPKDVCLLGIDNVIDICERVDPPISSIAADFERAGWLCADLLIERLGNRRLRSAARKYPSFGVIQRASTQPQHGFSYAVQQAVSAIRSRACDGLVVDDVAAAMGCSRRLAELRFRHETNKTIKAMITEVRLERVQTLLHDRSLSLGKLAAMCGYGTENALRIAFRKQFGVSLSASRRDGRTNLRSHLKTQ